jgi:hypothetical protein
MWRETIARLRRFERPAADLVTGPIAFLIAGLIDVAAVLVLLTAHRLRSQRSR